MVGVLHGVVKFAFLHQFPRCYSAAYLLLAGFKQKKGQTCRIVHQRVTLRVYKCLSLFATVYVLVLQG